jgi:hypothetical protein
MPGIAAKQTRAIVHQDALYSFKRRLSTSTKQMIGFSAALRLEKAAIARCL